MITAVQNKGLKVRERQTHLIVPHEDTELTFIHQSKQKGNYVDVRNNLESQDLLMPTIAQTVSLIYSAFRGSDNKYSRKIIRLMRSTWLWGSTGILWTPKGVYIQDNPFIVNGEVAMNESALERNLKKGIIRFVPYGFKLGKQSSLELSKNNFIKTLVGEQGADNLAEIADEYKREPYLYAFKEVSQTIQRVASLYSPCGVDWLSLGSLHEVSKDGCAFGMFKNNGEATFSRIPNLYKIS